MTKKEFKNFIENAEFIHIYNTGEEFIVCGDVEIYMGKGDYKDWAKFIGEDNTDDIWDWTDSNYEKPENWEKIDESDTVTIEIRDYPDEAGGRTESLVFVQKNTDVLTPVTEHDYEDFNFSESRYKKAL